MQDVTPEDSGTGPGARPLAAVLAVKGLADAKTRLSPVVADGARESLVLAMMADTITAARAAGVDDIVVVTPDPQVDAAARALGARVVPDAAPSSSSPASAARSSTAPSNSLNRAFARGIEAATAHAPGARVVVLQADLPALRAAHLAAAIDSAADQDAAMIPDRSGAGTAMLIIGDTTGTTPRFGAESARAHREAGAVDLVGTDDTRWPDLRTDVDTVDDLAAAMAIGVGARTAQVLTDIGLGSLATAPAPHAS